MITSLDNKKVKEWTKLHNKKYRDEEYLIFDEKTIKAALNNNLLNSLIYVGKAPFDFNNSYEVTEEIINKISKRRDVKVIGVAKKIVEKENYKNRVLLLDGIQDPINLGRIIELCNAFNFDSLVLSEDTCDLYHEKCIENAKDNIYKVSIKRSNLKDEINKLKENSFKIYSTGLSSNTKDINEIKAHDKMAFILGNEGSGISEEIFNMSDQIIKIDMNNIDSLNVAVAGAIVLYRFQV